MNILKNYRWLIWTVVLTGIACTVAVITNLYGGKDLSYETFAAVLGVIITAVITLILLKGQSENDVNRERNAKIFEEKLRIYQNFLSALCETLKDGKITKEEALQLQFQSSYIAMHTSAERINKISKNVSEIITLFGPNNKSIDITQQLLDNLFSIVKEFKIELYGNSVELGDFSDTITNFANFSDATVTSAEEVQTNAIENHIPQTWDSWKFFDKYNNWEYKPQSNCPIYFQKKHISFFIHYLGQNRWRFVVKADKTYHQRQLYIYLRYTFGGRFSTVWDWSVDLEEEYQNVAPNDFIKRANGNDNFAVYIHDRVDKIMSYLDNVSIMNDEITLRFVEEGSGKIKCLSLSDKPWPYFNETIAFDFKPLNDGTKPFVDMRLHNGVYWLEFATRNCNNEEFSSLLKQLGYEECDCNSDGRMTIKSLPSVDAYIEKIIEIDKKLSTLRNS